MNKGIKKLGKGAQALMSLQYMVEAEIGEAILETAQINQVLEREIPTKEREKLEARKYDIVKNMEKRWDMVHHCQYVSTIEYLLSDTGSRLKMPTIEI